MNVVTRTIALIAAIGLTPALLPAPAAAQSVTVMVAGQPLTMNPGPIERSGRVFVPLRSIFERLGATVVYSNGTINATRGQSTVSLQIGSTAATLNGQQQYLDVAPFIVGATTYVPLRFIAQSLGANVDYNDSTRVVAIAPHGGSYAPVRPPMPPPAPRPGPQVSLYAQQPSPGASVANRFAVIAAQFSRGVRPGTVRVWLDGNDVTYASGVSASGFSYRPPSPLAFGGHTVRASGVAQDGSTFDRRWSFDVAGSPPAPFDLRNVTPSPGTTIKNRFATISADFSREVAAASVRVRLDGADRTNQSGISRTGFSFKPPAPLDFGSHTVRVTGNLLDGAPFDRTWNFSVAQAPPQNIHLTISQPTGNAAVGTTFVVRGNTVANGRINVTAGATPSSTGQFTGNTTAGPLGNFSITVNVSQLMGQQSVTVRIRATDPATSQSTETTLQLRLK